MSLGPGRTSAWEVQARIAMQRIRLDVPKADVVVTNPTEYAVALASELANRGEFIDPSDSIVEIRETLNRIARAAAPIYA